MEYDKKALKIAAKITVSSLSESGKLDEENAKSSAKFLKEVYGGIVSIKEREDYSKAAFKAAGKITAAACEEMEEPNKKKAAEAAGFFKALYAAVTEEEKPACNGKYVVKESDSGFSFRLAAGNNQVIGVSEVYSSRSAMEKGIKSVRKNAPTAGVEDQTAEKPEKVTNPKFEVYKDKAGEFRFRLKARNGEIILASEGYKTKIACENGIESVRRNSPAEIAE